jgi:hypothetical protein
VTNHHFLDGLCFPHFYFEHTQNEIKLFLKTATAGEMLFIEGPRDVGKKTAIHRIARDFANEIMEADSDNDQIMPVISFKAPALGDLKYYTRSFLNHWIEELIPQSADILLKLALQDRELADNSQLDDRRKTRIRTLMKGRETRIMVINEAQRLTEYDRARRLSKSCIFDVIQSIAEEAGCVVVFTGEFGSFDRERVTSNVIESSTVIDFPAYYFSFQEDYDDWGDLIDAIKLELPQPYRKSFSEMEGHIMVGSLGCLGLLKKWLNKAITLKKSAGYSDKSFSECLEITQPDLENLDLLSDDLYRHQFTNKTEAQDIRRKLGLTKKNKPKSKKKRAFKRNSKGDPVANTEDL